MIATETVFQMFEKFVEAMTAPDMLGDIADYPQDVPLNVREYITMRRRLMRAISGMVNEAGEANQIIHKVVYRGHDLDIQRLTSEVGDQLFYIQQYCNVLGITLEELITINITKLRERYPDGYDLGKDVNRDVV